MAITSAANNGDVHPPENDALPDDTQPCDTLMFVDGGSPKQIKEYVMRDPRAYEYKELDALFHTHAALPVLCGFDCTSDVEKLAGEHENLTLASISKKFWSWYLLFDNTRWQITKPLQVELIMGGNNTGYIERYAAVCEIQQIGIDTPSPFLRILLLKCARGKALYPAWHVTQETREQLVDYIASYMDLDDMTTVLAGDIGMSFQYLASHVDKFSDQVEHCSLPTSWLTLLCRHISTPALPHTVQDYAQNGQIMIFKYPRGASDAAELAGSADASANPSDAPDDYNSSDIAQFAGSVRRNRQLQLMKDTKLMLGLLAGSDGERPEVDAFSLYHGIQKYDNDRGGGEVAWKPTSIHSLVQQLGDALTLARQARAHSGSLHSTGAPAISLSPPEFEKALDYCKHVFHEQFMLNENLRQEYTEFRNDPDSMTRSEKKRYATSSAERFAIG